MRPPLIQRLPQRSAYRHQERGVTMALVAVSLVAIISFAALAIDIGTLYEAKAEAQRAADAGALAAARIMSLEGITGEPLTGPSDSSWTDICGGTSSPATLAAVNVAQQNLIAGAAASKVNVFYGTNGGVGNVTSCTAAGVGFTLNPIVQVYVQQASLPTFFARVFSLVTRGGTSNSGVSATATAEVYNPSGSGSAPTGMIPVQPRCVKPWIVPNYDPGNTAAPNNFVSTTIGTISRPGIAQLGGGVIGEVLTLTADCNTGVANCEIGTGGIIANPPQSTPVPPPNTIRYIPALVAGTPVAVPSGASCSLTTDYQSAIGGCDQSTIYACGTTGGAQANLAENPAGPTGDTFSSVQCLINNSSGRDTLTGPLPPALPNYPFAIQAGFGNPLVQAGVAKTSDIITVSNSIATIPIYDGLALAALPEPTVTIVGYLQVFINGLNPDGSMSITVLNVAGCSNSATNPGVTGTSPVPIRLITSP